MNEKLEGHKGMKTKKGLNTEPPKTMGSTINNNRTIALEQTAAKSTAGGVGTQIRFTCTGTKHSL